MQIDFNSSSKRLIAFRLWLAYYTSHVCCDWLDPGWFTSTSPGRSISWNTLLFG